MKTGGTDRGLALAARDDGTWTGAAAVEGSSARSCLDLARDAASRGDDAAALRWVLAAVDVTDELPLWLAASRLAGNALRSGPLPLRPVRVAVVGTTTTSQLAELLPLAGARAGLQLDVWEAPYGQLQQQVLDPSSGLYAHDPDVVVLAVHEGDVAFPQLSPSPDEDLDREVDRWQGLWRTVRSRSRAQVLQLGFVVPPERPLGHYALRVPGSRSRMIEVLNVRLADAAGAGVALLDCERLAAMEGKRTWGSPKYWHQAKQAVSLATLPLLARSTAAVLAAQVGTSRKCIVLDLDNTLWGGVLGEDGLDGIQLGEGPAGEAFADFQDYLVALKARGVLLAVCSKNDEALVRTAFETHPGMRLRLDDIAVLSAGWSDKPTQVRDIATALDLGLDALVFVDDNPVERESVRRLVPEVDVLRLPPLPADYVRALADYPYLETVAVTEEDGQRTAQYRARAQAAQLLQDAPSLTDYLVSLDMVATVVPVDAGTLPRVAQLVGKTNQFNLTSRRRGEDELRALAQDPSALLLAVRLRDRFADHGLVGVLLAVQQGSDARIDTWLMSCRVIGRTLEHEMLAVLAKEAEDRGCTRLVGAYVPSAKNGLVADLYPRLGFTASGPSAPDGTQLWEAGVDVVPPGHRPVIRVEGRTTRGNA